MKEFALIFDLDETILPSANMPDETFNNLLVAIRKTNNGAVEKSELEEALKQVKRVAIDTLADKYRFNEDMKKAAKDVFENTDYHLHIKPFDDYEIVKSLPGIKILVTSGVINLQQEKINALKLNGDFDEIIIDDVYAINRPGKKEIFENLAKKYKLQKENVWIIGDNPEAEINAGKELGMITVQRTSPWFEPDQSANYIISTFAELKNILNEKYVIVTSN